MTDLGIRQGDISVRFIKSSGRGGQKVNKTASAVFLRHEPTGLSVKFGKHRSQTLNRFLALRLLVEKLEVRIRGVPDKAREKLVRLKKQKQKRKKRARQKTVSQSAPDHPEHGSPAGDRASKGE